jgi:hypothetical protein
MSEQLAQFDGFHTGDYEEIHGVRDMTPQELSETITLHTKTSVAIEINDIIWLGYADTDNLPSEAVWTMMQQYLKLENERQDTTPDCNTSSLYIYNIEKLLRYPQKRLFEWAKNQQPAIQVMDCQTAEILDLTDSTVKSKIERTLGKLRQIVARYYLINYIEAWLLRISQVDVQNAQADVIVSESFESMNHWMKKWLKSSGIISPVGLPKLISNWSKEQIAEYEQYLADRQAFFYQNIDSVPEGIISEHDRAHLKWYTIWYSTQLFENKK